MICADHDLPDAGEGACCYGAGMRGPGGCTCWRPVYDLDQAEPVPAIPIVRPGGMCGDCAYRPGSPEKDGDPKYRGDADHLEHLAATGTPFSCHDGLRRLLRRVHPSGVEVPADPGAYDPPILDGQPFRADGQPALLCAGWAARGRAIAAQQGSDRG